MQPAPQLTKFPRIAIYLTAAFLIILGVIGYFVYGQIVANSAQKNDQETNIERYQAEVDLVNVLTHKGDQKHRHSK